jgi:hypothetical protein
MDLESLETSRFLDWWLERANEIVIVDLHSTDDVEES